MYERLYLDLDRTVLNTSRFSEAVIAALEEAYDVPASEFQQRMPDFYIHHGAMQYYDCFAHVTMLGLDIAEVKDRLRTVLQGGDYVYADARRLIKTLADHSIETIILSYGPHNYQDFKFSFLPEVSHIPFVATLEFKEEFLAAQSPKRSLLVDDKLVSPLPDWCDQFLIDRAASVARRQEGERLWRINSLEAVESALSLEYNEPNQEG